jgi:hypothetical protein
MCQPSDNRLLATHSLPDFDAVDPFADLAGCADGRTALDLPGCPACAGQVQFSSTQGCVTCPACGWQIHLTPDDSFEWTKALIGLSNTPATVLLHMLVQALDGDA